MNKKKSENNSAVSFKPENCKITDSIIRVLNRFGPLFKKLEKLSIFENCIMLKFAFI